MKYRGSGGGDVVPMRRSSVPASAVVKVARKVSGSDIVSPRAARVKIISDLTESALAAYTAAGDARDQGEGERATLLEQRAAKALELAHETAEEIAAIG